MSDVAVVGLAAATALGAWEGRAVPVGLAAIVLVVGFAVRRPVVVVVGSALLSSGLAVRALAPLASPTLGRVAGWANLVSDPEPTDGGVRVDVRLGGRRYEATAFGAAAGALQRRAAGELVEVEGRARPVPPEATAWLTPRHVGALLDVEAVTSWSPGGPVVRLANALRRTLERGASVLSPDQAALFAGFVLGDDRNQRPQTTDDFRASGLSHLLAVSGENVAFMLAVASPLLRRLGLKGRFATTVALIAFFAVVTRGEPSVLRASVMAALAAFAFALGREASGVRLLGLAVTGLVLVDPLLVHSLGFGLSVGASLGILVIGPPLTRLLPGPRWLASAVGVTLGAQAGVAPLMIPAFGGVPIVSVPANLLAAPAAGPLVAWGMTAGVAAGLTTPICGDGLSRLLHLPTAVLVSWIAAVARAAARVPAGELRAGHLAVLLGVGSALVLVRCAPTWGRGLGPARLAHRARRPVVAAAVATFVGVVGSMVHAALRPAAGRASIGRGVVLYTASGGVGSILVLDEEARASPALEALRRAAVRRVAVLVVTSASTRRDSAEAITAVVDRYHPAVLVGPPELARNRPGAVAATDGVSYRLGDLVLRFRSVSQDRLSVSVVASMTSSPDVIAPTARAPPREPARDPAPP